MPVVWLLRYANRTSNLKTALTRKYRIDSIRASVERHLRESEYPHSLRDKVFDFSTRAMMPLFAKKIQLKKTWKRTKTKSSESNKC
jgi:hypothetical protein